MELVEPQAARGLMVGEEPVDVLAVRWVHAALSDPDVPDDPGPLTLCGMHTAAMVPDRWQPDRLGRRWFPPRWAGHICLACDTAVRAT
ncbi:hypothetical protein [Kitasatospora kazusensis]|uniref:hypothetical protein n=1 Tax=Kitasatospora kazusensis TaxID=407974 RepID=UPI0031E25FEE